MVHALREAHRVLKPDGLLIDLRPAAVHRRVGFRVGDEYRLPWMMRENFDDDHAADRSVAEVLGEGLFKAGSYNRFDCHRVMDTLDEFVAWLTDFVNRDKLPSHDWLVHLVKAGLQAAYGYPRIVVSGPLVMQVLQKNQNHLR